MKMQFFAVPAQGSPAAVDALNDFLSRHRISGQDVQFVADGAQSYWAIRITYVDGEARVGSQPASSAGKAKVDYRELLSAEDFAIYARLRELRKQWAAADGVPPYQILTNEQLATIVQQRMRSRSALAGLAGFGEARMQKYGEALLAALANAFP